MFQHMIVPILEGLNVNTQIELFVCIFIFFFACLPLEIATFLAYRQSVGILKAVIYVLIEYMLSRFGALFLFYFLIII